MTDERVELFRQQERIAELEDQVTEIPTIVRRYEKRIAELKREKAQCKEAFAAVSENKPMGPIVEKHLIQNMQQRIAELEAENKRLREGIDEALNWNWLDDEK